MGWWSVVYEVLSSCSRRSLGHVRRKATRSEQNRAQLLETRQLPCRPPDRADSWRSREKGLAIDKGSVSNLSIRPTQLPHWTDVGARLTTSVERQRSTMINQSLSITQASYLPKTGG
jgi:hypothetical protein